jgi:glycosyltransferase involved in cell wall biosynthesis
MPSDWRHGAPFVHEIWAPSVFTANAVCAIAGDRPVRVIPYAVALRKLPITPRVAGAKHFFTALLIFNMASSFARKNPLASIAAFRKAFGDDQSTRLIVKISNGNQFPSGMDSIKEAVSGASNIVLVDRTMTPREIDDLYRESDVVISLHRSEGFGLTLAEAMLRGVPVIATDWSGSVDFLHVDNSLTVPYRLVFAVDPQGTYHYPGIMWAEANVDAAAAALQRLRREPEFARYLGETGAAYAARIWSAEAYVASVRGYLGL